MSRSGYVDDSEDQWSHIRWRGAVKSAIRGNRGQSFLREMADALDALPNKALCTHEIASPTGDVCALGAVAVKRGLPVDDIDPENSEAVARTFGISDALAREIVWTNDEAAWSRETPEQRFQRMRAWVDGHIKRQEHAPAPPASPLEAEDPPHDDRS